VRANPLKSSGCKTIMIASVRIRPKCAGKSSEKFRLQNYHDRVNADQTKVYVQILSEM